MTMKTFVLTVLTSIYGEMCNEDTFSVDEINSLVNKMDKDYPCPISKNDTISLCSTLSGLSEIEIKDFVDEVG